MADLIERLRSHEGMEGTMYAWACRHSKQCIMCEAADVLDRAKAEAERSRDFEDDHCLDDYVRGVNDAGKSILYEIQRDDVSITL